MPSDYYWVKLKKKAVAVFLSASILLAVGTGAVGWKGGKDAQFQKDQTEITKYQDETKRLVDQQKDLEGSLDEFLQDLRGHLAADAEIEHLFKARDLNSSKDSGDAASVECCKQEAKRMSQYFINGVANSDPRVRVVGKWLSLRCAAHFSWLISH